VTHVIRQAWGFVGGAKSSVSISLSMNIFLSWKRSLNTTKKSNFAANSTAIMPHISGSRRVMENKSTRCGQCETDMDFF